MNREEARKALLKAPLFQAFEPAVFDAYITHGLYEDPTTGFVHLKCPPACEGSEYTENRTMHEGWELLPTLDERVELRWILGGRDDASSLYVSLPALLLLFTHACTGLVGAIYRKESHGVVQKIHRT